MDKFLQTYKILFRILLVCSAFLFGVDAHAASLDQQRINFVKAETALKTGRTSVYQALVHSLNDYALVPYLRYLELRNSLSEYSRVEAFLSRYEATRYAELLRGRYLTYLASTRQWKRFLSHYKPTRKVKLQCNYHWALYQQGQRSDALRGAESLWLVGESQPDECNRLFAALQTSSVFTPDLAWRRFQLALQKGRLSLARYLRRLLSDKDKVFADRAIRVHINPNLVKSCTAWNVKSPKIAWVFIHGIDRLARTDPLLAQRVWTARRKEFSAQPADTMHIDKRLAMALVFRHHNGAFNSFDGIDPKHEDPSVGAWRIRAALVNQNWQQLRLALDALPFDERPALKWRYWEARTLAAEGKQTEAEKLYQELATERDFYGFLAADHQGLSYSFSNHPSEVTQEQLTQLEAETAIQMVREFLYFNRQADAQRQWWHAIDEFIPSKKQIAAKLAQKWGLVQTAIFTVAKAKAWDDLELRFPILYREPISSYAQLHNLAPSMLFGLIRQESVFDAQIVSPAGARGLMQIMPATGRQIARQLGDRWRSSKVLFKPNINVKYGTSYLSGLLTRHNGNFALAAAGYNAGPHRVQQWLTGRKSMDSDIWVETIPFKETRRYVRRVLAYTMVYQYRLGHEARRITSYMPRINVGRDVVKHRDSLVELTRCR